MGALSEFLFTSPTDQPTLEAKTNGKELQLAATIPNEHDSMTHNSLPAAVPDVSLEDAGDDSNGR